MHHACVSMVLLGVWLTAASALAGDAPHLDRYGDPLPPGAVARLGTTRYRLTGLHQPQSATLSPDGQLLAVLRIPDEIEIWELPAWKRHRVIKGQNLRRLGDAGADETGVLNNGPSHPTQEQIMTSTEAPKVQHGTFPGFERPLRIEHGGGGLLDAGG